MPSLLIVEDNLELVNLYQLIFSDYAVCILGDSPDAIDYLQVDRPDLVIMEFHLPSGDGMPILDFIRSQDRLKTVPVLGVSIDDSMKYEARQHGLNAFLVKPIEIRDLRETVEWLLTGIRKPRFTPVEPEQDQESPAAQGEPVLVVQAEPAVDVAADPDPTLRRAQVQLPPDVGLLAEITDPDPTLRRGDMQMPAIRVQPVQRGYLNRLIGKLRGL